MNLKILFLSVSVLRCATLIGAGPDTIVSPLIRVADVRAKEPLAVLSIKSLDDLFGSACYLGAVTGKTRESVAAIFGMAPFLEGLDRGKPLGVTFDLVNGEPVMSVSLAVTDKDLAELLIEKHFEDPKSLAGGIKKIKISDSMPPVFLKIEEGWLHVATEIQRLNWIVSGADELFGDHPEGQDIRISVRRLPLEIREMLLATTRKRIEEAKAKRADGVAKEQSELVSRLSMDRLVRFLEQSDRMAIGIGVDQVSENIFIDFEVGAVPGSELSEQFKGLGQATTRFGGLDLPQRAFKLVQSQPIAPSDIVPVKDVLAEARQSFKEGVQKGGKSQGAEEKERAERMVDELFDVLLKTVEAGRVDSGLVVGLEPRDVRALVGIRVSDGARLEALMKEAVAVGVKSDSASPFSMIKMNMDQHSGVNFHQLNLPTSEMGDGAGKLFGDRLQITLGTGADVILVAVGRDGVGMLKEMMRKSDGKGGERVLPYDLQVFASPMVGLASRLSPENKFVETVGDGGKYRGRDRFRVSARPVEDGVTVRLEMQTGAIQLISKLLAH